MMEEPTPFSFWRHLAMLRALVLLRDGSVRTLIGAQRYSGKVKVFALTHETVLAADILAVSTTDGWRRYHTWNEGLIALTKPNAKRLPPSSSPLASSEIPYGPRALTADQLTFHPSQQEKRHPRAPYLLHAG